MTRFRNEMGDLFGSFFRDMERPSWEYRAWPTVDITEREDAIVVRAEIPGCKPSDMNISIHGSTLTLSGEKKDFREEKEKGFYHAESMYGRFEREVELPAEVNENNVEAVYKDGVLSITLPKAEQSKAVKIQVKGE